MDKFLGHTIHTPLFAKMFSHALPLMQAYHSDLGHDTLKLAKAKAGDVFLWAVRDSGTNLFKMEPDTGLSLVECTIDACSHSFAWIVVTGVRFGDCADGIIIHSKVTKWEGGKDEYFSRRESLMAEWNDLLGKL